MDDEFKKYHTIRIIKNNTNIGKSKSFKIWYHEITKNNKYKYFVSIDPDIKVKKHWLPDLIEAAETIGDNFAAIAPLLCDDDSDTFNTQIANMSLTMHGGPSGYRHMKEIHNGIYYNRTTAGSAFLISRQFYEKVGGYPGDALFGRDDGYLCRRAIELNKFVGFTTNTSCIHLNKDNTDEYKRWKTDNLNRAEARSGHWDQ